MGTSFGSNQRTRPRMTEDMSASILAFLSADAERFEGFLATTGLDVSDLRTASTSAGFGENLLEYLSSDERLFLAYAYEHGLDPARLAHLRDALAAPSPDD